MCWHDTACDLTTSVRGRFSSLEWQYTASRIGEHAQRRPLGLAWYVHRAYTWSSSGCAVLLLPLCENPLSSISLFVCLFVYLKWQYTASRIGEHAQRCSWACSCLLGMYTVLKLGRCQAVQCSYRHSVRIFCPLFH